MFAVSAAVLCVPLVASVPLQPPDAVHEVASVELQVSADVPPLATFVGAAVSVAVGSGAIVTVAVAAALVPPGPVHVNEYVSSAVRGPVVCVPLLAKDPLQVPPEAVQEVALVELQLSVAAPPLATELGETVSVAVGAEASTIVTVALATGLVLF